INAVVPPIGPSADNERFLNIEASRPTLEYWFVIKLLASTGVPVVMVDSGAGPPGTEPAAMGPADAVCPRHTTDATAVKVAFRNERRAADMDEPPCMVPFHVNPGAVGPSPFRTQEFAGY